MVSTRLTLSQFLSIVELRTKLISLGTFAAGTLYAVAATGVFSPRLTLLMFLAVLLVDMGTTAFNNFFDFLRGTDVTDFNVEENKVLVHQRVAPGWALVVALGCFLLAGGLGIWIAVLRGWWIVPVGAFSMLVGYFYTGGPRPLSTTPVGELFAGGFLGMVLFLLSAAVQTPPGANLLSPRVLLAGLPQFLTVAAILAVNNSCDRQGDAEAGRRTFAVLFGTAAGEALIYLSVAGAQIALALLIVFGPLPSLAWAFVGLSTLYAAWSLGRMRRRGYHFRSKGPNMIAILKLYGVQTGMYLAGLLAAVLS